VAPAVASIVAARGRQEHSVLPPPGEQTEEEEQDKQIDEGGRIGDRGWPRNG
jgi:hypothetical protein